MPENEEYQNPVYELAKNYQLDLDELRNMDIYVITQDDINKLSIICKKYGMDKKITKENFVEVLGDISAIVNRKLEKFIREDVMERSKEGDITKSPKSESPRTSEEPAWDKDKK